MNNKILRILIVEDDPPTARRLRLRLQKAFPGSNIEMASTMREAQRLLEQAEDGSEEHYDIVVQDMMLPVKEVGDAEINSLGFLTHGRYTIMAYITGRWEKELEVRQEYEKAIENPQELRVFQLKGQSGESRAVAEGQDTWVYQLIEELKKQLHVQRIRRRFDELFGRRKEGKASVVSRRVVPEASDRTRSLEVAELCDDAASHWRDLPPKLRREIAATLGHAKIGDKNWVGVMDVKDENGEPSEET